MNILAFDTAFDHCSVALVLQEGKMICDIEPLQQGHAEALVPKIRKLLQQMGLSFQDLGLIAVGVGPGSFTGVRVAVATARGLALAGNIPVVGVNSFEVFSVLAVPQLQTEEQLYVVLDARRRDLFYQMYDERGTLISEPQMMMPGDLLQQIAQQPSRIIGTGALRLQHLAQVGDEIQSCAFIEYQGSEFLKVLAQRAQKSLNQEEKFLSCQPYYLAPPGITPTTKK